jgi:hypothetical protein
MTQRSLAVLIVLNVVLLTGLSVTVMNPTPAEAQFNASPQFTMISGKASSRDNQDVIFIVDLSTSRIAPVFYNGSSKKFEFFEGRTISEDLQNAGGGR